MHMPQFQELLAQVFERRGYTVAFGATMTGQSGTSYQVPLLAKSGANALAVLWKTDQPLSATEATSFAGALTDLGLAGGVLVAWAGAEPAATGVAVGKVEVWNQARTAAEVGDAILAQTLAPAKPTGPVPMTGAAASAPVSTVPVTVVTTPAAAPTPAAPIAAAAVGPKHPSFLSRAASAAASAGDAVLVSGRRKTEAPSPSDGRPLGYAWTSGGVSSGLVPASKGAIEVPNRARRSEVASNGPAAIPGITGDANAPATRAPSAPSAPRITPPHGPMDLSPRPTGLPPLPATVPAPTGTQVLTTVVAKDAALGMAATAVGNVRAAKFALVPHVAFDYDCHVESEYFEKPMTGKGTVLVNAITGTVHNVAPMSLVETVPEAAEVLPAKFTAVDVYDKVKAVLTKVFVKEVSIAKEIDGNEISDTKRISASLDDLNLNHRGIVMVPTWVCQGEKGTAQVDAANALVEGPPPAPAAPAPRAKDKGSQIY